MTRNSSEYGLYTVSEVRQENSDNIVRMGEVGRERLGTSDDSPAPRPAGATSDIFGISILSSKKPGKGRVINNVDGRELGAFYPRELPGEGIDETHDCFLAVGRARRADCL